MKEKDYSYLEGKEVKILPKTNGCGIGIVGGCDFDIGITIIDKEDKSKYLFVLLALQQLITTQNLISKKLCVCTK